MRRRAKVDDLVSLRQCFLIAELLLGMINVSFKKYPNNFSALKASQLLCPKWHNSTCTLPQESSGTIFKQ
jgi:hypothetical protein